jgi:hypothetical protein
VRRRSLLCLVRFHEASLCLLLHAVGSSKLTTPLPTCSSEHASVVIPIGDSGAANSFSQYMRADGADPFQSSAAIALAIETAEGEFQRPLHGNFCSIASSASFQYL